MLAIEVENLSKIYKIYEKPIDRLKEALHPLRKKLHKEFYALKNISFQVEAGQTVGIIGKNGSGKSTLLKILTGVLTPSSGNINIKGRLSALLELGAGFNPELTGIENVYLNGAILGYSKEEINDKLKDILDFADIGEFINQPVKTYSSGMFVRLAFAVAINVDPDILIVDEALAVGDIRFQQKCFRKIEEFKENKTVLFVSHDLSAINKFCDYAIWINDGCIIDYGEPSEVTKKYQAFMMGSNLNKYEDNINSDENRNINDQFIDNIDSIDDNLDVWGDNKAIITGISLIDSNTKNKNSLFKAGQKASLYIRVKYNDNINNPIVGFTIKDRLGNIVTQSNSYILEQYLNYAEKGTIVCYKFDFTFPNLKRGIYTISPAVASGTQEDHVQHCWIHDALVIQVIDGQAYDLQGFIFLEDINFCSLS
ncbi:MAG: transporter ATP-binding protein [Clostridiales bacterium]|jgi:ABC-type polysaccharide/polyol phosphate transport system ATPase subunit|nr:transporter ATP-binding protein [Clostridiales bacterium]